MLAEIKKDHLIPCGTPEFKKEIPHIQIYRPLDLLEHSLLQKFFLLKNKNLISTFCFIRDMNESAILGAKYLKN
ncbi:hypothetical protein D0T84_11360 [Dysgonomonas sp. 521]|nr:hypothetical protein [Dysgonomonas sp. 521]